MIVKLIGGAPFAISIILTIFMGGLGLGSFIASRIIDRIKKPINLVKLYGLLELIIGVYALLIPLFLVLLKPLFSTLYNHLFSYFFLYNLITFIGCSILLCIPVICMGATLPILCKYYVNTLSRLGTNSGRLYGLNTIGAALGSLICGFWLLSHLGIQGTLYFAVAINLVIGITCLAIGTIIRTSFQQRNHEIPEGTPPRQENQSFHSAIILYGALVIFSVSGFCSMAYEVIWTKLLGLVVGPTTYSFTIVLVTFISGLALGSMFFGFIADRTSKPMTLLISTQLAAALFALGCSQLLGSSQFFFAKLLYTFQENFILQNLVKAVTLFVFMILPTLCLGATFPLVSKIYTQSVEKIGRSIGFAYTINTIGAVLGSFCAGFVLIPLLGKEAALSLVTSLQLICSSLIVLIILANTGKLKLVPLFVPAALGLVLCFYFPSWNRSQLSLGKYHRFEQFEYDFKNTGWIESLIRGTEILARTQRGQLVYCGDGISGFTTVERHPGPLGVYRYSMLISGKPDASSHSDMKTQTLLAHFPMLFHPNPRKVMVLGLASGITPGEVLYYPIDQLDVLDINREVVAASDYFLPWNNNVLTDARTNLIIQDGRAHLQLTDQKYDVIISEPSNPWMAGLAALFTEEFFELGKEKLNQQGVFVQWLHTYQMDWETVKLIGRTFTSVFPNSIMVSTAPSSIGIDSILVGFRDINTVSLQTAKRNLTYAQKSKNINLKDPRLFYRLIVAENLQKLFGSGPVNTDNQPNLEFYAPKLMYSEDASIPVKIKSEGALSIETQNISQQLRSDIDLQIDFVAYILSVNTPFNNMVDLANASSEQKERYYKLIEAYCLSDVKVNAFLDDQDLKQRCIAAQIRKITDNIDSMPDKALSYQMLGDFYYETSQFDYALKSYNNSMEIRPDNSKTIYNLGVVYLKKEMIKQAKTYFYQAIELDPQLMSKVYNILGISLSRKGEFKQAAIELQKYLQINPDDPVVHNELGVVFANMHQVDLAIKHFSEALRLKPDFEFARRNLQIARSQKTGLQNSNNK